jgi:hypothetical protein
MRRTCACTWGGKSLTMTDSTPGPRRFAGAGGLNGCGVDYHDVVPEPRALAGEGEHHQLKLGVETGAAFVPARLADQAGEQADQPVPRGTQEPSIGRNAHQRLRDKQRDDLRVAQAASRVLDLLRQEIVGGAEHNCQQQVEVGVHSRPPWGRRLALQSTADFDLLCYVPFKTPRPTPAVESLI